MNLLFISSSLGRRIIDALSWMLVHSLWQGLLLAVVAGIVVLFTKKASPSFRYNLFSAISVIFIAATMVTFLGRLNSNKEIVLQHTSDATSITNAFIDPVPVVAEEQAGFIPGIIRFFNEHSAVIVFIWLLVIGFRCFRLIGGLYSIRKIKRSGIAPDDDHWTKRTKELCTQLGITKQVRFFQSAITRVPMVLGHIKPIILFPAGVLVSLSPSEIEAILIHELAHIRRNDYLANIIQSFLEIVFFFNPAAIWVSGLIKAERENCCDDIAVARASNKRNYINALLSFQEYHLNLPQHVTAFGRRRDHLLHRVKRIIYNNNKTLNAMEKLFLASGLLVTGLLVFAFSSNAPNQNKKQTASITQVKNSAGTIPARDTVPNGPSKVITTVEGKEYVLVLKNDKLVELSIDGIKIPSDKINDYKAETDKIITEVKAQAEKAKLMAEESAQRQDELKIELDRLEHMQEELQLKHAGGKKEDAEKIAKELSMMQLDLKMKTEKIEQDSRKIADANGEQAIAQAEREKELALLYQLQATAADKQVKMANGNTALSAQLEKLNGLIALEHQKLAELDAEKELLQLTLAKATDEPGRPASEDMISHSILEDLMVNGLIEDPKKVSVKLNSKELIINGVKQSAEIHKKFKDKYVKKPGWSFSYSS